MPHNCSTVTLYYDSKTFLDCSSLTKVSQLNVTSWLADVYTKMKKLKT